MNILDVMFGLVVAVVVIAFGCIAVAILSSAEPDPCEWCDATEGVIKMSNGARMCERCRVAMRQADMELRRRAL